MFKNKIHYIRFDLHEKKNIIYGKIIPIWWWRYRLFIHVSCSLYIICRLNNISSWLLYNQNYVTDQNTLQSTLFIVTSIYIYIHIYKMWTHNLSFQIIICLLLLFCFTNVMLDNLIVKYVGGEFIEFIQKNLVI